MRLLIPVVIALSLTGCAGQSGGMGTPSNVKQIQELAVNICRFLPAAQTVASILISSSNMFAASAFSVASSICAAVTTNPLADGPGARNYKPHVNGVRIRGQFVR